MATPIGKDDLVLYHGSLTDLHGLYIGLDRCDCEACDPEHDATWERIYWSVPLRKRAHMGELMEPHVRFELEHEQTGERLTCVHWTSISPSAE
ncbi:hypothetical protein J5X84_02370 [Streptosporangiaceae bacterium NEAU-GS5]|nr:hypothetical protein [Streptosporangiaceae bacterium NEAU-GS5]